MYITKLAIVNYKSCQNIYLDLQKDNANTFIGINDSGKSAVLKSLGLLLEAKPIFSVSNDIRVTSDISNTRLGGEECKGIFEKFGVPEFLSPIDGTAIIAEFSIEEKELNEEFNAGATTQFKWAIDTSPDNTFLLLKYFTTADPAGKYYLCLGEDASNLALWSKKAAELQTIRKKEAISDADIANENGKGRFASFEIIRAIYNKLGTTRQWAEAISFAKTDLPFLPTYRYIDWNTSMTDIENLANDVMKSKVEASKALLTKEAIEHSKKATDEVNKEFEAMTQELTQDLKTISGIKAQVNFTVAEKISDLIINKTTADGDIRLDSQGEGIKRQILFSFLKWASKKGIADEDATKRFIWCFDEPEVHLYPSAQRELYTIISDLAKSNYQVFLGTHSTIFVNRSKLTDIYRVKLNEKYSEILKCTSVDDVHDILGVKNSDILFFDKFIAVEGESEDILIPHFYKLHSGKSLEEAAIKLISLGGVGEYKKNRTILEGILGEFKKTDSLVHYVFDADTEEAGNNIHLLGTCDLEDLLENHLWIRLVQEECGVTLTDEDLNTIRKNIDIRTAASKLHKALGNLIANDATRTDYLPSKPKCAAIFQKYITKAEEIPPNIKSLFETIDG